MLTCKFCDFSTSRLDGNLIFRYLYIIIAGENCISQLAHHEHSDERSIPLHSRSLMRETFKDIDHARTPRAPRGACLTVYSHRQLLLFTYLHHFSSPFARPLSRSHSLGSSYVLTTSSAHTQIWFLEVAAISLRSTSPFFDNTCIYILQTCTYRYSCSWLIYVYTYAINYADTICTRSSRDPREILARFVRRVYVCVCGWWVNCIVTYIVYMRVCVCVQDIGGFQSLDWCVERANGRSPMADETSVFSTLIVLHPEGAVEKMKSPRMCMRLQLSRNVCMCRVLSRVYVYVCVSYTCVRHVALVCISFGRSLTLRLNNAG